VHVIATGGTIATRDAGAMLSVEQLMAAVPGIDRTARISTEQFLNRPSSQITPAHWLALSRRITELFRSRPALRGIVVTHGTDTMEETALFLHLTVADPRPVVVTGAMRSATDLAPEGPANLRAAIATAAAAEARGRGTLVVMNDEIFSGADVAKHHTSRLDAFVGPAGGPIGAVDQGTVGFHRPASAPPTRFDSGDLQTLPRVDIVAAWAGADGALIDAAVAAGARGIVIASVGRGNMPDPLGLAARRAVERGVVVVVSSRTGAGRVPIDVPDRPGLIGAAGLNPPRARVVLMLALARGGDGPAIARMLASF
jgi:L-asparaginase